MRTLLTFLSMPFSTIAIGLATNDFLDRKSVV